ncbi:hypothetical protein JOF56_008934 [Kibdelosporangium banguiense]|uniref:Uncharacterized protein n=1 Tax=Kibdelosporangium banguiense TaxID=1365924 RepID=A0ABS4TVY4_9PSEU|nr:hypothetical protein [Kibdelosporangium banguiense]
MIGGNLNHVVTGTCVYAAIGSVFVRNRFPGFDSA